MDVASVPAPASDLAETVTIPGRSIGRSKGKHRKGRVALAIVLALLAIGGAAWASWTYLIPHEVDVPKVVGLSVDEAQKRVADAGLVVRIADGRYSTKVPAGSVLTVQPAEGSTLEQGDRVSLVPSLGPRPCRPEPFGPPLGEAVTVQDADLKVGDVTRVQRAVRHRPVIRQSVRDAERRRQRLDLVVSKCITRSLEGHRKGERAVPSGGLGSPSERRSFRPIEKGIVFADAGEGHRPAARQDRHDRGLEGPARVPDAQRRRHGP
jgi:serine/threonine-protein kinase